MALTLSGSALGLGKVLQVVEGSTSTMVQNTTNVAADTGLSATITPSSTSSKVLVLVFQNGCWKSSGNTGSAIICSVLRNGSLISYVAGEYGYTGTALEFVIGSASTAYLDSPATTSAVTYKTQFWNRVNASAVQVQTNSIRSSIVLVEVAP